MNKIFSPNGVGWPSFPKRSYGKLDQIEPLNAGVADRAGTSSLDVVDADWSEFASGGRFDLSNPILLQSAVSDYWAYLFRRIGPPLADPYDSAPVYRIEITSIPGDDWYKELLNLSEEEWVLIELDDEGRYDADVFGALLQAIPVAARLRSITRAIPQTNALNIIFSPDTWPDAQTADIQGALSNIPALEYLVGLDVGQGAAIGLADANEDIHMYFDLGGGVYRNAPTRPNPLRFCWRMNSPIVLSHWDADHWSGESSDPQALPRTWIAPRQNMTTTHILFVNRMLNVGGTLHMWGPAPGTISVTVAGSHTLELRRCTGPANKRNGSGIAAVVEHFATGNQWLLTGDAGYHEIGTHPSSPVAIVVPHHGADMGTSSVPPGKPASYTRLFYSFGPGNRHGRHPGVQHPTSAAMAAHFSWNHGSWTAATPGNSVAGGEILACASHPGSHLNGVVMGWSSAPAVPLLSFPCSTPGGCTCTGTMTQS